MNLSIATFFFVAASASAHNLRAHAPVRYLNSHSSSSSSSATEYDVACVITCPGLTVDELEKAAKKALKSINSSSSSSEGSEDDGQVRRGLKSGDTDKSFLRIDDCSEKSIEKDLESLESSSSSRRGRVRRLSDDEDDITITCIDASSEGVQEKAAKCGVGLEKLSKLARDGNRRLDGDVVATILSAEGLERAMGGGCGSGPSRD